MIKERGLMLKISIQLVYSEHKPSFMGKRIHLLALVREEGERSNK